MNPYEVSFRTLRARGITFTQEQMQLYGIKKIINSVCCAEFFTDEMVDQILIDQIEGGNICLLEAMNSGKAYIISVIIFEDVVGRNLFAIRSHDFYGDNNVLLALSN